MELKDMVFTSMMSEEAELKTESDFVEFIGYMEYHVKRDNDYIENLDNIGKKFKKSNCLCKTNR